MSWRWSRDRGQMGSRRSVNCAGSDVYDVDSAGDVGRGYLTSPTRPASPVLSLDQLDERAASSR